MKRRFELTPATVEKAIVLLVTATVAFVGGYFIASAQIAAMLNH